MTSETYVRDNVGCTLPMSIAWLSTSKLIIWHWVELEIQMTYYSDFSPGMIRLPNVNEFQMAFDLKILTLSFSQMFSYLRNAINKP